MMIIDYYYRRESGREEEEEEEEGVYLKRIGVSAFSYWFVRYDRYRFH